MISCIIDTDVGPDDVMAIAFMLAHPGVRIEAITIANGLAHVEQGGVNLARLVAHAGQPEIPVYLGRPEPLEGDVAFPNAWRKLSDEMPGVVLPETHAPLAEEEAASFLARRLQDRTRPVQILALGPLTNLAEAERLAPNCLKAAEEIVIMGGAFEVEGNVFSTGEFVSTSDYPEWNIYTDPVAAEIVFKTGAQLRLVPLDATNTVPIDTAFREAFAAVVHTPLGRVVEQVISSVQMYVDEGLFFAWDLLAAVAMMTPEVLTVRRHPVEVELTLPHSGWTRPAASGPDVAIGYDADRALFTRFYIDPFT